MSTFHIESTRNVIRLAQHDLCMSKLVINEWEITFSMLLYSLFQIVKMLL